MEDIGEITERNTVALVVLYYPEPETVIRLKGILRQLNSLLVIDNTPAADRVREVWEWGGSCEAVTCLDNTENVGLGVAYNRGFAEAGRRGAKWVLLLDQDTDLTDGYLFTVTRRLESVGYRNSEGRRVGVVGVNFGNPALRLLCAEESEAVVDVRTVISSGSLVSTAAWRSVSGFDEDLFIDYVDVDFCLRVKSAGYGVVFIGDVLMSHEMGHWGENSLFGVYRRVTANYSALRHYYITRNFVAIARKHGRSNVAWIIGEGIKQVKFVTLSLLMEGDRRQLLRATTVGVVDGVRGVSGRRGAVERCQHCGRVGGRRH